MKMARLVMLNQWVGQSPTKAASKTRQPQGNHTKMPTTLKSSQKSDMAMKAGMSSKRVPTRRCPGLQVGNATVPCGANRVVQGDTGQALFQTTH